MEPAFDVNCALPAAFTSLSPSALIWQDVLAQAMTGENGLRRAEDIGGQELSYAEVKAIASGGGPSGDGGGDDDVDMAVTKPTLKALPAGVATGVAATAHIANARIAGKGKYTQFTPGAETPLARLFEKCR